MKKIEKIKNYVYDNNLLIEEIKKFPHTYKTLLKEECYNNSTMQFVLRTKLNKLHKKGDIAKSTIPGTRFGIVIFYTFNKKYNVIIESERIGVNIYCFFKYKKISTFYILVKKYYVLNDYLWTQVNKEKTFFLGKVLKWL